MFSIWTQLIQDNNRQVGQRNKTLALVQLSSYVQDLRTGGVWFNPQLGQYYLQEYMIVIPTGFIPLSPLSSVSTMVMWESSLHRISCRVLENR